MKLLCCAEREALSFCVLQRGKSETFVSCTERRAKLCVVKKLKSEAFRL